LPAEAAAETATSNTNNEDKYRDGLRIFESLNDRGGNAARSIEVPCVRQACRAAARRTNYQECAEAWSFRARHLTNTADTVSDPTGQWTHARRRSNAAA
jgi:hypothetical protein